MDDRFVTDIQTKANIFNKFFPEKMAAFFQKGKIT